MKILKSIVIATVVLLFSVPAWSAEEVNVYSARKENLIKPLLDQFSQSTGIRVNLITAGADELIKRLQTEGRNSPADILLTVDAGRLHAAEAAGLLQTVESDILNQAIPAHFRDLDNHWFGLSLRSRVIVYSKDRVSRSELSTYEDLAYDKWKGRICIRSSGNIYNQSLLASLIAHHGVEKAEAWAKAVVVNMARSPKGNDRAQVKAVAVGECDIAVVNTYYIGMMQTSTKNDGQKEAVAKVAVFYPNQDDRGAHMNVSGAGVVTHSKNRDNAVKLLEFLVQDESQRWYAEKNFEYPVKAGVAPSDTVKSWGYPFKQDSLDITMLGIHNAEAVKVFDRAGWK